LESHGKEDHWLYAAATSTIGQIPTAIVYGDKTATTPTEHFLSNKFIVIDPSTGQGRFETDSEFTQRIQNDLTQSKQTLERAFGKPIIGFAYPYNDYGRDTINFPDSQSIINTVVSSMYELSFYQVWGNGDLLNHPDPAATQAKRIEPDYHWSGEKLVSVIESGLAKTLPYHTDTFGIEWQSDWGIMTFQDGLSLQAAPTTTGSEAMLDGSSEWRNYSFDATIDWKAGENVTLVARAQDNGDYIKCDFLANGASVGTFIDHEQNTIARGNIAESPLSKISHLKITVSGNTVSCFVGDTQITSGAVDTSRFQKGGVGIQIWDPVKGVANIAVNQVDITPL
jgi:hypothetical protein